MKGKDRRFISEHFNELGGRLQSSEKFATIPNRKRGRYTGTSSVRLLMNQCKIKWETNDAIQER